ncbi:Clavaminate synthase-like protein [Neurospora crassa]|uniref:Taurine catabolism dioxygenase TauD n=1 Tax=Neurospora crassa (strain ATCC 24698 / 74-OR23-1A / CBS 708.71 / DSM 1257 / FGSC 987) TaxID=367110 RepID=Q7SAI5_NEUCR|nr:taurine catabolism dioxygenase TauD [Neurospora crassa OR74A]EAA33368.2 taurine catabolism dioxygenase TauD [Neurospora crassa OR74A]KHE81263.1 Clavaminate synthase-like protein [Neurospora crassa]|eukprot:XP_962604.2 taurine catabolism dioxygenase TauD [Neurospora crassa OR74A]
MACPLQSTRACNMAPPQKDTNPIVRPEIDWIPSYKVFKERVQRLAALNLNRPTTLPAGWPAKITSERVWSGSDFKSEDDYVVKLSQEDILEIESALGFFKTLDLGPDDVSKNNFPLLNLGPKLEEVSDIIHNGRGFVVLRGLNPDKYSSTDNILLYLGVTSYIAETRGMQDFDGRMILHIQAVRKESDVAQHGSMPNSPYVNRAQPFHTDLCDVLSLYALGVAKYGGESFLASSATIYNEIARLRPDVIHVLARDDWPFDEFYKNQYHMRPLLYNFSSVDGRKEHEHGPGFQFSRRPLTGAHFSPHHPLVPAMSEVQAEALDMVYFLAKEHALAIQLQKGDMQIFNNFAMLHARSSFVDEGEHHKRHMLRLWLRNEQKMWRSDSEGLDKVGREVYEWDKEEWRREVGTKWDIEQSPPELRVDFKRASCA